MTWRLTRRQLLVRLAAIFVYAVLSGILVFHDLDDNDDDISALDKLGGPVITHHVNGISHRVCMASA